MNCAKCGHLLDSADDKFCDPCTYSTMQEGSD